MHPWYIIGLDLVLDGLHQIINFPRLDRIAFPTLPHLIVVPLTPERIPTEPGQQFLFSFFD